MNVTEVDMSKEVAMRNTLADFLTEVIELLQSCKSRTESKVKIS
jgi:hypothetical protein